MTGVAGSATKGVLSNAEGRPTFCAISLGVTSLTVDRSHIATKRFPWGPRLWNRCGNRGRNLRLGPPCGSIGTSRPEHKRVRISSQRRRLFIVAALSSRTETHAREHAFSRQRVRMTTLPCSRDKSGASRVDVAARPASVQQRDPLIKIGSQLNIRGTVGRVSIVLLFLAGKPPARAYLSHAHLQRTHTSRLTAAA